MNANVCRPKITSVVIYGSQARGDIDLESDFDICVFTNRKTKVELAQLTTIVEIPRHGHLSITSYSENDLFSMIEYGSLFLWHLKQEGRILYGSEYLASHLSKLKPFERHGTEISYYYAIFSDLTASLGKPCNANEFDLALLFTIARNTCMVLTHKAGLFAFGRRACYYEAARVFRDIPLDEVTYLKLSKWKMIYERGVHSNAKLPSLNEMELLVAVIKDLLEYARAHTC